MLDMVGVASGSVMGPVMKSQAGRAFFSMVPGQVLLASLDAVSKSQNQTCYTFEFSKDKKLQKKKIMKNVDELQTRFWTQQKQLKSKHFWRPRLPQQEWCQTDLGKVQGRQLGMCLPLQGTVLTLHGMCSRFGKPLIQLPLSLLELSGMLQKLEAFK